MCTISKYDEWLFLCVVYLIGSETSYSKSNIYIQFFKRDSDKYLSSLPIEKLNSTKIRLK